MKRNGNFKAIFSKIFEFMSNHLSMREQLGLDGSLQSAVNHIMKPKKTSSSESFKAN